MDISKLNEVQFAQLYGKIVEKIKEDPINNFVKASGFIDLDPTPAQEVILKVIFGKLLDPISKKVVDLEDRDAAGSFCLRTTTMTEVEIYEFLTESKYNPESIAELKINKINLICGRRSGKTLLSAIIAIYCAISNNWKPFLKKTPFATVLIMSHSTEFSDEVLEIIRTLIETSDILTRLINKDKRNTASTMNLRVPFIIGTNVEYSRVQIKVAAASSKTTRGVAACAILCDEIAFWNLDEKMKETDIKIMKAVRPSMKQFGKFAMLIKLSSPGIKQGVLYSEYKQGQEGTLPDSYAVFKAPTWLMSPRDVMPESELQEEYKLDEASFSQEYGGNFADSLSNFIRPDFIDMAVLKGVEFQPPEAESVKYEAAIDAAYKADAFTFSVVAYSNNRLKQYISKGWKGTKDKPVSSHEVAEYIRAITKQYGLDRVSADQYAFQPLKEIFERYGVTLEESTFSSTFKKKIYFNLKKLVHSQQIDLVDNEVQTRELKELIVEQTGTGNIRIGHPAGGTDDYSDSLAIAAFMATENVSVGQFEFAASGSSLNQDIKLDRNGTAFSAPSADLLAQSGHLAENVFDNSDTFQIDPKTNKLVRKADLDEGDPDDGVNFNF